MDATGWLSRCPDPVYAEPGTRRCPARRAPDSSRPDASGGSIGSDQGRLPQADASLAEGASVQVPETKGPRSHPFGSPLDLAQLRLADQLTAHEADAHQGVRPDQGIVGSRVDPPDRSPV